MEEEKKQEYQQKVDSYITKKEEMKVLDKDVKTLNKDLMSFLYDNKINSLAASEGSVNIQVANKTSWDEEGLVKYLEENNIDCVVTETIKKVDADKLAEVLAEKPELADQIRQFQHTTKSESLVYKLGKKEVAKPGTLFIPRGGK